MSDRRADGELEADILGVLWGADRPLTPGEVNELLGGQLAYTTVMTVLTRLWKKDLAVRKPHGRGFAYSAAISESELTTQRMSETLAGASDRALVLTKFVHSLPKRDISHLRRLLGHLEGERR